MKKSNLQILLVFLFCLFMLSSCTNDDPGITSPSSTTAPPDITENGTNPDETILLDESNHHRHGYLYTESNASGQNNILVYKQNNDGSLTLVSTVPSGGNGAGMGLGNQGALNIHRNGHWLFAVNAGSNSVSSFLVAHDGSITLAHTASTGGTTPVSVTSNREYVYVVNSGSDNISGFEVGSGGELTALAGSIQSLSGSGTMPAQISFSPNGHYLYVTEKMTNKITAFPVDEKGIAGAGVSISSTGQTPFGFDFSRDRFLITSNASGGAPNASTVTSYKGINSGNLTPVNGAVPNNQTAACWVAVSRAGSFAYITNTGSDNISTYYVGPLGRLHLVHQSAVTTGDAPTDIVIAPNNYYVYAINSMSHSIGVYKRQALGGLSTVSTTGGLPEFATGLVVK